MECLFGILQRRFLILRRENQRWDLNEIVRIGNSCVIIHNILIRFSQYEQCDEVRTVDEIMENEHRNAMKGAAEYNHYLRLLAHTRSTDPNAEAEQMMIRDHQLTGITEHIRLQDALIALNYNPV